MFAIALAPCTSGDGSHDQDGAMITGAEIGVLERTLCAANVSSEAERKEIGS